MMGKLLVINQKSKVELQRHLAVVRYRRHLVRVKLQRHLARLKARKLMQAIIELVGKIKQFISLFG